MVPFAMSHVILFVMLMAFMKSQAMNFKEYEEILAHEEESGDVPLETGLSAEFVQEFTIRRSVLRQHFMEKYNIPEFSAYGSPGTHTWHAKEVDQSTASRRKRVQAEMNRESENLGSRHALRGDSKIDYLDVSDTNLPSFAELAAMDDDSFLGNSNNFRADS